jgi:hypothetical protein
MCIRAGLYQTKNGLLVFLGSLRSRKSITLADISSSTVFDRSNQVGPPLAEVFDKCFAKKMLGCIQPMSSPIMKTMLGFCCCCADACEFTNVTAATPAHHIAYGDALA